MADKMDHLPQLPIHRNLIEQKYVPKLLTTGRNKNLTNNSKANEPPKKIDSLNYSIFLTRFLHV